MTTMSVTDLTDLLAFFTARSVLHVCILCVWILLCAVSVFFARSPSISVCMVNATLAKEGLE